MKAIGADGDSLAGMVRDVILAVVAAAVLWLFQVTAENQSNVARLTTATTSSEQSRNRELSEINGRLARIENLLMQRRP